MSYIFKQKFQLSDLAGLRQERKRIVIFEPEEYLAALYGHYLYAHNFDIKHCWNINKLREAIINFQPELLIFCADTSQPLLKTSLIPGGLISEFPNLKVVSTGYNLNSQGIGELMAVGVISHINRRLSRPQDIVEIVKTLLL
jgi:hypothetical protein